MGGPPIHDLATRAISVSWRFHIDDVTGSLSLLSHVAGYKRKNVKYLNFGIA